MVSGTPANLDDLARLTGEPVAELRQWQDLGLLRSEDDIDPGDVERVKLIRFAARRGIPPDEVARIIAEQGDMLDSFVRWAPQHGRENFYTPIQAAERSGLDADLLDRVWAAAGLRDQTHADEEDIEALRLVATALQFGLPEEVLLQVLRVFSDALGRAADAATRAFHLYVHEGFRAQGLTGADLMAATQAVADPMVGLVEPAVLYFHRKALERANREDFVLHLIEESTAPGELVRAILFVDLSSYTPLTEAMGDTAAAQVVARFSEIVRASAAANDGQVVKQIGDEFMLAFSAPALAVSFGVAVHAAVASEPMFPGLRIGAHCGPVLYREGDYYGATVNLAARVTAAARRDQFLVTDALFRQLKETDAAVVAVGARPLKGITEAVELLEVQVSSRGERPVDPVCGMAIDPEACDLVLDWRGGQLLFCSMRCRGRFVDQPEVYASRR